MRISDWSSDVCSSDLVHYADLHAQLVDEDHRAARPADRTRQLAQALRHQTRLEPDMAVAHLALDLGARHQRGDRVDDEHVDRVRAHQRIDDFERLFAGVGLRHAQFVDFYPHLLSIDGGARMFAVYEARTDPHP